MKTFAAASSAYRLAMTTALVSMLTACGASMSLDKAPVTQLKRAGPPADLTVPCDRPSTITNSPQSAGAVERGWAEDRAHLAACADRHAASISFYRERDAGLAGP